MTFSDLDWELARAKEIFPTDDGQTMGGLEASYVASDSPEDDTGQLLAVAVEKCMELNSFSQSSKRLWHRRGKAKQSQSQLGSNVSHICFITIIVLIYSFSDLPPHSYHKQGRQRIPYLVHT